MNEWAPPTSSDFPGQPTDGVDALLRRIEAIRRDLDDATNNLLTAAGLSVDPNGLTVDSSLVVNGSTTINGDLLVPNGAIKNDWLENPVTFQSNEASTVNMPVTTSPVDYAVANLTVPAGYTVANATVLGSASVFNDTASTQYAYLTAYWSVNGTEWAWGGGQRVTLAAGFWGSILAPLIRTATGLDAGDTLSFFVKLWGSGNLAANPNAWAGTEVNVTFSR